MSLLCSIDGAIGPADEGQVSITDDGFQRGDGAFEMLRLYGSQPFALEDHMERLDRSAAGVFLEYDRDQFEREIAALLEANDTPGSYLRLIITRGGRRVAIIEPQRTFMHGLKLSSVTYQPSVILNGLKTLSYEANMTASRIAKRDGADEALLVQPDGNVLEAPTSTIFWVGADGELHTPKLQAGVLASITRDRILKVVPVNEGNYKLADISAASEVFLASSLREVQGVEEVDGLSFNCPGPITERVAGLLSERIQAEMNSQ